MLKLKILESSSLSYTFIAMTSMGKAYKLKLVIKLQAKYTGYHAAYIYVSS